ncbi:MAG: serine/threonine protein kinase [Gemmatimonadetes bacterium]|nr:serine/threonine protein kinase [Gemmatimonadota bacterium]
MSTHPAIGINPDWMSTGSSFEEELQGLIWRRVRLIFALGLGASLALFVVDNVLIPYRSFVSPLEPWRTEIWLMHAASYAIALLVVLFGRLRSVPLQMVAMWVTAFNIVLLIAGLAVLEPGREPHLGISLLLFTFAAFVPCRVAQTWLAGIAVTAVPAIYGLSYAFVPEVATFWAGRGGASAQIAALAWNTTGTAILAVVSVAISRNLYSLRKTAFKAERLGNYLIERELGAGGMGQVFLARHALMCRPTAVKVVRSTNGEGLALQRFEQEVRLSSTLTHPNTITIFDFGRTPDNTFYYAMEYLAGMDLQRLIERHGPLPANRAVYILRQVCGSLAEAHSRGIVHRDIKPSNIFLTQRGGLFDFVKVLDFGLAKRIEAEGAAELTKTGMLFGTPQYIAPETVYGTDPADHRSDLYNVGGVAYWLLTGQPLFASANPVELIIDHVKTVPRPPSEVSEIAIPPVLETLVMRLLEKKPDDRFGSASEVDAALREIASDDPWTKEQAREWWELHVPPEEMVTTECA